MTERLVMVQTATGQWSVTCDHCGMDELVPGDKVAAFVRGRIAAHVDLMATVAEWQGR